MRRPYWIFLLAFLASACVRSAPIEPTPAPTDTPLPPPTAILVEPSETPLPEASPTAEATEAATETPVVEAPTETEAAPTEGPTATSAVSEGPTATPTQTQTPTATLPTFNAETVYGTPQLQFVRDGDWGEFVGKFPDTSFIGMEERDGQLAVTDKSTQFDTWWFSWPTLNSFFVEVHFQSEQCSGKDGYGVIFHGPQKNTSDRGAYGYAVLFSCDGSYLVRRIDSSDPVYSGAELSGWVESDYIRTGANQINQMGILYEEHAITIFANGQNVNTYYDGTYEFGRIGLYIGSDQTQNYTYRVSEVSIWRLP